MWKILVNDGMESEGVLALQSLGFKVDCNNIPQNELNEKLPFMMELSFEAQQK